MAAHPEIQGLCAIGIDVVVDGATPEMAGAGALNQTPAMTPRDLYQLQIHRGDLVVDAAQSAVVDALQDLYERTKAAPSLSAGRSLWRHVLWRRKAAVSPCGLYVWGGVGRGKTWLMDIFFHSLPFAQKERLHFHRFMRLIHAELDRLKGRPDPLQEVAAHFARRTRVLCLDEFHVCDIGDAMLLGQLLKGLFAHGVTLVATSNTPPDELYKDGLQRANFLPAIDLLKKHTQVLELGGQTDYRLQFLERAEVYHAPLGRQAEQRMRAQFQRLASEAAVAEGRLRIEGREIVARALADAVAWFDFEVLCGGPRSTADYIEIARCFSTVLLSDIPLLDDHRADRVRRFMHLVDEFYDRNVKLIISAAVAPDELYQDERLVFEYRRTVSRLQEMQGHAYLARAHRPD